MFMYRLLPLLALGLCAPHVLAQLNDTGIAFCSNANTNTADCATGTASFPRQDGHFVKPFSFTKIANNGTELPAGAALGTGATEWACTKDNVTGLIWEVKTTSGLRSQNHTYTWYNSNPATNGGAVGAASGTTNCATTGRCDTEKYVADVNTAGLCGATDWRMPSVKELESIVDFGRSNPAIDPTYFPNTPVGYVWSGSPAAFDSSYAWFASFSNGGAYDGYRYHAFGARLVRGGQ